MTGTHPAPDNAAKSVSPINMFVDHQGGSQQPRLGLKGSLGGFLPSAQCHAVFATYPGQVWPDGEDMSISPKGTRSDILRISRWTGQLNRTLTGYHDIVDSPGQRNAAPESSAENLRKLMEEPRDLPTLIYVSGHTDSSGAERFYLASDSVVEGKYDMSLVVFYSEFRNKLLLKHHQEPVILVTDMCNCENVLKLPYVYSYANGRVTCTETEYYTGAEWDSTDAVHFAATLPDQQTAFFSNGSVYNKALQNVPLDKRPSLERIVEHIQVRVDEQLGAKLPAQHHRVYSSRKFDGDDFFGIMGFSLQQCSTPRPNIKA